MKKNTKAPKPQTIKELLTGFNEILKDNFDKKVATFKEKGKRNLSLVKKDNYTANTLNNLINSNHTNFIDKFNTSLILKEYIKENYDISFFDIKILDYQRDEFRIYLENINKEHFNLPKDELKGFRNNEDNFYILLKLSQKQVEFGNEFYSSERTKTRISFKLIFDDINYSEAEIINGS